ncbi:spermine oxidase-like [Trichogramma pretiosum]|uniref:spermine oxidase-like n=1 Tax=Trichogramma pretiosum TaxID=7493 RepID=UPI0006C99E69|nr:spermine oxidase-like [Trichogramma pretiosum]
MDLSKSNSNSENIGIVIIGAGIAGLAAAVTLEKSNYRDYKLIEAQDHVGGRICSIPHNNGWLEKGAQFLHGNESTLGQLAQELGLISDEHVGEGEGLYLQENGAEMNKDLILEVDDIVKNILEDCEKFANNIDIECNDVEDNIGNVLESRFYKYLKMKNDPIFVRNAKEEIYDWNIRFLIIDNACNSLENLSVKSWGKFKAVNGPEHNIFESHYSSIVDYLVGELNLDNLILNTPVTKVEWDDSIELSNNKPVTITLQNKRIISADCVIITCSLGFLKESQLTFFSPLLPKPHRTAIENLGFGLINKIYLDFDEPWWEPHIKGFQFLWKLSKNEENNPLRKKLAPWVYDLTGFDVVQNHKAVLLGWIGGKGAQIIETLSESQVIQDCKTLFRYFLKNDSLPEANKCVKSCWGSNRYFKGSYSHITKKCDITGVSPATLAEPIWGKRIKNNLHENLPILMFAGEATHENYYSTTHGAYDTGVKQANIFLKHFVTK